MRNKVENDPKAVYHTVVSPLMLLLLPLQPVESQFSQCPLVKRMHRHILEISPLILLLVEKYY